MTTLEYALTYAACGWAVFPVYGILAGQCACGNPDCSSPGKHPMTSNGCKAATTDIKQITDWWSHNPDTNIGIATGSASGLVVVDVDDGEGKVGSKSLRKLESDFEPLPREFVVRTGGGGLHIYLTSPHKEIRNSAGKVADNVDIRGENGYVVAPPSKHISGNQYIWEACNA